MPKLVSALAVVTALALAACTSGAVAKGEPATTPDAGPAAVVDLEPPAEAAGMQLALKWVLGPGEEKTNCLLGVAPVVDGGPGVYATAFEHQYTKNASHHILLYPTGLSAQDVEKYPGIIEDCAGVENNRLGVYYGSQGPEGSARMPNDVGLLIPSGSVMMVEFHTLNTDTKETEVEARINIEYTPAKPAKEAGVLFHYDQAIHVSPASSAKSGMHCVRDVDINLIEVGSHMHARGVGFTAQITDSSGAMVAPLYETKDWEGPKGRTFDPPLRVSKDQAIDFECMYENSSANEYFEGFSAINDEMCVLTGLYYVDEGVPRMSSNPFAGGGSPEWCNNTASRVHTYGTGGCTALRQCIEQLNSEVGATTNAFTSPRDAYKKRQVCESESTDDASRRFDEYIACRSAQCYPTCVTPAPGADAGPGWNVFGAECQTCLATNCAAQIAACAAD